MSFFLQTVCPNPKKNSGMHRVDRLLPSLDQATYHMAAAAGGFVRRRRRGQMGESVKVVVWCASCCRRMVAEGGINIQVPRRTA